MDKRDQLSGTGTDSGEIHATQFAAALLMPGSHVHELVSAGLGDGATVLGALAALGVSAAGLEQIAKLKLGDVSRPSIASNLQPW